MFKIGERIICINNHNCSLKLNETYCVYNYWTDSKIIAEWLYIIDANKINKQYEPVPVYGPIAAYRFKSARKLKLERILCSKKVIE
jgi:hypothetical protein